MSQNASGERVTGGWVAPLVSTVITLPEAFFAFVFAGVSGMACDSCDGAAARRFDAEFGHAMTVLLCGLALSLAMVFTSWVLPRRERYVGLRLVLALLAPPAVFLDYLLFYQLIDLP